jgi:hypothetical protein
MAKKSTQSTTATPQDVLAEYARIDSPMPEGVSLLGYWPVLALDEPERERFISADTPAGLADHQYSRFQEARRTWMKAQAWVNACQELLRSRGFTNPFDAPAQEKAPKKSKRAKKSETPTTEPAQAQPDTTAAQAAPTTHQETAMDNTATPTPIDTTPKADLRQLLAEASQAIRDITRSFSTAMKQRQHEALSLVEQAEALKVEMKALDNAEALVKEWDLFDLVPAIETARQMAKAALRAVAQSPEFKIAMSARAEQQAQAERQAVEAEERRKAMDATNAQRRAAVEASERSRMEADHRFIELNTKGILQREKAREETILNKDGRPHVDNRTGLVLKRKIVLQPAVYMPLWEVVSRRSSKKIADLRLQTNDRRKLSKEISALYKATTRAVLVENGVEDRYIQPEWLDAVAERVKAERFAFAAANNPEVAARLIEQEAQETVKAVVKTGIDAAELEAGKYDAPELLVRRRSKNGKKAQPAQDEAPVALDEELLVAMEAPRSLDE